MSMAATVRMYLPSEQQTIPVRAVGGGVASRLPASAPRKMGSGFVRVALVAETTGEGGQHLRVIGAVRAVAFHTAFSGMPGHRVVFEDERAGDIGMARLAHLGALLQVTDHPLVGGSDS